MIPSGQRRWSEDFPHLLHQERPQNLPSRHSYYVFTRDAAAMLAYVDWQSYGKCEAQIDRILDTFDKA
ncbi:hypothetical protein TSTA_081990 [Talaromyces stipitatus ATCC 10500]|uniref:Uncharacterized protein n=1 Tax=Talaromyces stipitatus (strain ATCC 10500 / CBS 375.48 / QM 6759 / NRRL 1006) TaxID=441959 RepID=B8M034_TALSN|nr:uncharacterized protein TSTA_081990 [Talaromyces stipitatus ATCC 10500]EED20966.1 hypothetical protein TSTA_081990 [Talaromyces stipitatus ATCC 10500]